MTTFQLLSDIHLRDHTDETYEVQVSNPCSDVLLLAGDIGNACDPPMLDFLIKTAALPYQHVIMVKGNHELFGTTLEKTDTYLDGYASVIPKLVYLNRTTFDIPNTDIRIAGCTLWSHVNDAQRQRVEQEVGDFKHIREWSLEKRDREHNRDVDFIINSMGCAVRDKKRLILLTHHAPVRGISSAPAHAHGPYTSSYECDLEHMIVPPIVAACFGHTHFSMEGTINGVQLYSNQHGRCDDYDNTAFRDDFTFTVHAT